MTMQVRDRKLLGSGLLFLCIGLFASVWATNYRIGSATRMGPGYFPLVLGLLLVLLGLVSVLRALLSGRGQPIGAWPLVPAVFVLGGVVAFGLLVGQAGLALAIVVLVALACWRRLLVRPLETAVLTLVLGAVVIALFIYGLGLPLTVFGQ